MGGCFVLLLVLGGVTWKPTQSLQKALWVSSLLFFLFHWPCSWLFKLFSCFQGPNYLLTSSSQFPTGICWVGLLRAQDLLARAIFSVFFSQENIARGFFPIDIDQLPQYHHADRFTFALFYQTDGDGIRKEEGGGKKSHPVTHM